MAGNDWQDDSWFVDEWRGGDRQTGGGGQLGGDRRGTDWRAADFRQSGRRRRAASSKAGRNRLIAGFALGAATVLAVQFGSTVVTSPPVAVVAGTALPAAGAAAPAAAPTSPSPTTTAPAVPAAQTPSSTAPPPPPPPPPQRPGTVRLPAGGTATLVRKDLGPGGELPIPEDLGQATWWGAELDAAGGASVFAGHVNWRGATGPFAEIWTAEIGAVVTIVDSAGKPWRYRISQLVTVHKDDLPARAEDLFGQSGPHRVVLVTCGGRWVGGSDGYEENRVVVADPA
ncbi:class F sortase [Amycolatopsis sp. NPDC051106]|uniref:class F sortase n=1 Tax=unclassified Amycolatopsis TaxID=2618356 RepID=UPI003449992D